MRVFKGCQCVPTPPAPSPPPTPTPHPTPASPWLAFPKCLERVAANARPHPPRPPSWPAFPRHYPHQARISSTPPRALTTPTAHTPPHPGFATTHTWLYFLRAANACPHPCAPSPPPPLTPHLAPPSPLPTPGGIANACPHPLAPSHFSHYPHLAWCLESTQRLPMRAYTPPPPPTPHPTPASPLLTPGSHFVGVWRVFKRLPMRANTPPAPSPPPTAHTTPPRPRHYPHLIAFSECLESI